METLRQLSIIWALFHVFVLFMIIYRSRYSFKTTITATVTCIGIMVAGNIWGLIVLGIDVMGKYFILTCTLPSMIFYFFMSKDRGGRFFFTFCLVDTIILWLMIVTNLIDVYIHGKGVFMLVSRLLIFPAAEVLAYKYVRKPYLEVQSNVKRGWIVFAAMTALYYLLLAVMGNWPAPITDRPDDLPAMLMILLLMPMTYLVIFAALYRQILLFRTQQSQRELQTQLEHYRIQLDNQQMVRKMKHDMKGHFTALSGMLSEGKVQEARSYLEEVGDYREELSGQQYCADPYLNGVISQFVIRFEELGVSPELSISVEAVFKHRVELCLILSNALENALEATEKLPAAERFVSIQMQRKNKDLLLLRVKNNCDKNLYIREDHLPQSDKEEPGHGYGLRTIKDLSGRLNGEMVCFAEGGMFVLDVMVKI
ncbi:GHKL domain-containing protein [Anaerovorax odorimutans]|uniref:GHKL domain-containing protein n=1 Tax=Anaerovorax odorimutans TaxID=109327 RepID=A0ABT1RQY6_9FIRM|nr:GHKL domain-containing protein [Anaerovorax odorimutans]MCQ4637608.1 GHKL domain-containing protein [Anaerovorax odorimutans]